MVGQVGFLIPGSTGYGYCSQAQPVTPANQWQCANGSLATAATQRAVGQRVQERQRRRVADLGRDAARAAVGGSTTATRDTYGLRTAYDAMKLYLDVTMEKWRKAPDYTPPSGSTEDEHTVTSFLGDWSFPTGAAANARRGAPTSTPPRSPARPTPPTTRTWPSSRPTRRACSARAAEAAKYDALYARIKRDFNARFWNETRGYYIDRRTRRS